MKEAIVSLIRVIEKINNVLDFRQKKGALKVLIFVMLSSIFELLGVSMILPFVSAITDFEKISSYRVLRFVIDEFGLYSSIELVLFFGVILIVLYLLKNVFLIYSIFVQYEYATSVQTNLSVRMLKSYLFKKYEFFTDTSTSEILRGCSTDITSVYNIIANLIELVTQLLSVIAIGIFLFFQDPVMAISVLTIMAILLVMIVFVFKPYIKKAGRKALKLQTETTKALYQSINGIKEIKVSKFERFFLERYEKINNEARIITRNYAVLNACPDRIVEGVCISGVLITVLCRLIFSSEDINSFIPVLAVFGMGAFKIFPAVGKIASRFNVIIFSIPGLDNVYSILNSIRVNELENTSGIENLMKNTKTNSFNKSIKLDNISWKYSQGNSYIFENASLNIKKGEAVAFIGQSGAGKTTLSDILLGLLIPQKGKITIDDFDINLMGDKWANMVSYVPQNIYLFDDSIRNNVAFGYDSDDIDDDRVWEALQKAQLADFVRELPLGFHTRVGEQGVRLSGGQRQRIAIARALYKRPEVLVLDEATAALDNETESAVMEAINTLQGQITMVIVAHRLSTIKNCDHIYEVKDGRVVERKKESVVPT